MLSFLDMGNLLILGFDIPEFRITRPTCRKRLTKLRYLSPAIRRDILGLGRRRAVALNSRGKICAAWDQVPG